MNTPTDLPRLKGFRYPCEVIACAVWAYHRFALNAAGVDELLAERGVVVSREAIRLWINLFARRFPKCARRDRPQPAAKRHLDEYVISNPW